MGRIRVPPSLAKIQEEVTAEELLKYGVTDDKGRYLHWNDFQWRVQSGDKEIAACIHLYCPS